MRAETGRCVAGSNGVWCLETSVLFSAARSRYSKLPSACHKREEGVPDDGLDNTWRARPRRRAVPISTVLNFAPDGLVLGAGTVLLRTEGARRLQALAGQEIRALALLSAAYGRAVAPSVLGHIERAAKAWRQGDDCLAYVHLAHARLGELPYPHRAAERLVLTDAFLNAGGSTRTIFAALKVGRSYIDALEKDYNPDEPRVPAGSGSTSGQWTRDGEASAPTLPSYLAPSAPSWLGYLAPSAATPLGEYALSILADTAGAAAALGLIFIPSNKDVNVEGDIQEYLVCVTPGIRTREGSI
jgi:hypothetical protein